jgi:hypothetical protein
MNINDQMNQLGQIGSIGYAPTDSVIDGLLAKTKRARAIRQSSATVVGSVSAVALGVVGAQVYVTIDNRNEAATQDRNIESNLPGIFNFDGKYGAGYNGIDEQTRASLDKIYEDLRIAAQIQAKHLAEQQAAADSAAAAAANAAAANAAAANAAAAAKAAADAAAAQAAAASTGTVTTPPSNPSTYYDPWLNANATCTGARGSEHSGIGYYDCAGKKWVLNASYFQFGNQEIYKCETWKDAATGEYFQGAISNKPVSGSFNGDWAQKRIFCTVGAVYTRTLDQSSDYLYMGGDLTSWSGNMCTGSTVDVWSASQRISCLTKGELTAKYGTWTASMSGGSSPWTQNNSNRKILVDPTHNKWFPPCGRYYNISTPLAGWYWTGTAWAEVPTTPPAPSAPPA